MNGSSIYFVSVIIPVFNDSERLNLCLQALEEQTYPKNLYEIIVIDNASEEEVESVVGRFSQTLYTRESKPGSYAARNKGISLAKGDIFAFTDSDCIPNRDWLERGIARLLQVTNCGLVAGRVNLFFKDKERPTTAELYDSITFLQQNKYIKDLHFGATANLFTFKSIFKRVGLFDAKLKSGGDKEWGNRVFASNYELVYCDDACVNHPTRHSFRELREKVIRVTGGLHDLQVKDNTALWMLIRQLRKFLQLPALSIFRSVSSEKRLKRSEHKVRVMLMMIIVHYIKYWTRIQLQLDFLLHKGRNPN